MALAMATHPRLGIDSPASKLTSELCQLILGWVSSVVVIDMGSGWCRAGFAGAVGPCAFFPSIVGVERHPGLVPPLPGFKTFANGLKGVVGDEAIQKRGILRLIHPMEHSVVTNWDYMEQVYKHVFYEKLCVSPEEHPVLLTEGMLNPKANRERLTQVMFETFNVEAMYVAQTAVLSLYETGRTTGLVIESGEAVSWVTPVVEGYSVPHAALRYDVAGRDVTEFLAKIMTEEMRMHFGTTSDREMVCDIKEQLAFVVMNYDEAYRKAMAQKPEDQSCAPYSPSDAMMKASSSNSYFGDVPPPGMPARGLPTSLNIPMQLLFRCSEVLFQPWMIGFSTCGIGDMAFDSTMKCDLDVRADLAANVVLSGGTMQIPGMASRLKKELQDRLPTGMEVRVLAPTDGQRAAWRGGALLASLDLFAPMWIKMSEYDEEGPQIVHKKCF